MDENETGLSELAVSLGDFADFACPVEVSPARLYCVFCDKNKGCSPAKLMETSLVHLRSKQHKARRAYYREQLDLCGEFNKRLELIKSHQIFLKLIPFNGDLVPQKYWCHLCDRGLKGFLDIRNHLKDQFHTQRVAMHVFCEKQGMRLPPRRLGGEVANCSHFVDVPSVDHMTKAELDRNGIVITDGINFPHEPSGWLFCTFCRKKFSDPQRMQEHCSSWRHRSSVHAAAPSSGKACPESTKHSYRQHGECTRQTDTGVSFRVTMYDTNGIHFKPSLGVIMPDSSKALDDFWDAAIRLAASSDIVDYPLAFLIDIYRTCADRLPDGRWCRRQDRVFEFISKGLEISSDRYDPGEDPRSKEGLIDACVTELWIANNKIREEERANRRAARRASPSTANSTEASREGLAERRHPLVHGPSSGRKVNFSSDDEGDSATRSSKMPRRTVRSQRPAAVRGAFYNVNVFILLIRMLDCISGGTESSQGSAGANSASPEGSSEIHRAEPPTRAIPMPDRPRPPEPSRPRGPEPADSSGSQRLGEGALPPFRMRGSVYRKWEDWEVDYLDRGIRKYHDKKLRWRLMLEDPELKFAPDRKEEHLREKFKRLQKQGYYG
ncbi:hypothetical protein FOL47_002560 [Perkinsus chesapeaki]|uniref:C2H2-type domain-containing protein n=1 Tax=Perkinsus chesapeaki TaxID=330153 RepID=A0A7J6ME14_PERCH|nr:hypothetical protein FOL47_002560 [Perkinsus chesapeaki]